MLFRSMRYVMGVDKMMWGHDFPHPEGMWPYMREGMQVFAGMPEQELRAILGLNAAAFYHLDVAKLQPHLERIGPDASLFSADARGQAAEAAVRNMMIGARR